MRPAGSLNNYRLVVVALAAVTLIALVLGTLTAAATNVLTWLSH